MDRTKQPAPRVVLSTRFTLPRVMMSNAPRLLSLSFALLGAVPLLIAQPAPLEDWPSHLARVDILANMLHGDTFWSQYYHINSFMLPNMALDVGIMSLHALGLSISSAACVFLVLTYALFIIGGLSLSRAFGTSDDFKAPMLTILFYNGALMNGVVNYISGVGLALCFLAAWLQASRRPGWRYVIAVMGAMLVFFVHLVAATFLIASTGLIELYAIACRRDLNLRALSAHASPAAALAMFVLLLSVSPATTNAGGEIEYTGAPLLAGIVKAKLILFFHPWLDGSGEVGALILLAGAGSFTLLALFFSRPRFAGSALFLLVTLVVVALASPNGIGPGYALDYRLMVPALTIAACAVRLEWRSRVGCQTALSVLLIVSLARTGSFVADFWRDKATFSAFRQLALTIPPDSVLITGIGTVRQDIPWTTFWAPPTEFLATEAVRDRVFVPTVWAMASQHPLVMDSRFEHWRMFFQFGSAEDAVKSRKLITGVCSDWSSFGHTGPVLMLLVYPSTMSQTLIPPKAVIGSGPGFELLDACGI